jgi:uncharacterized protein YajQ (UPF0234 family)
MPNSNLTTDQENIMPSFDVVSEVNLQEVRNAADQANREISTRFDFKGTEAQVVQQEETVTLQAQNEFQLKQILEILESKLIKRGIALGSLDIGKPESNIKEAKQTVKIKQGIDSELAKQLVKTIKNSKAKVQAAIQEDKIRVTGKKRDDLQEVIALLRQEKIKLPLQYVNFRD